MMAATIARYLPLDDADREFLDKYLRSDLRNLRHTVVGEIRATEMLVPVDSRRDVQPRR